MKKTILTGLLTVLLIVSFSAVIPVYADSPEMLRNPGFESDIDYWQPQVNGEMAATDYLDGVTPRSGNSFVTIKDRYSYSDTPLQNIKAPLSFYGKGNYKVRGYTRLAPSSRISSTQAQIVIRVVSTDKTSGSAGNPGVSWFTSGNVPINKTSWTLLDAVIPITWSADIELAEFYFMTGTGDSPEMLCFDDTSMIKVGYSGPTYSPPTPTLSPTPRTPTPKPATPTIGAQSSTASSSSFSVSSASSSSPASTTQSSGLSQAVSENQSIDDNLSFVPTTGQSDNTSGNDSTGNSSASVDNSGVSENTSADSAILSGGVSQTSDSSQNSTSETSQSDNNKGMSLQGILGIVILVLLVGETSMVLIKEK
ncbi:MAG: hypothetical protein ACYCYI_06605 [Saccharofermentanales bacterium]